MECSLAAGKKNDASTGNRERRRKEYSTKSEKGPSSDLPKGPHSVAQTVYTESWGGNHFRSLRCRATVATGMIVILRITPLTFSHRLGVFEARQLI